MYTVETVKNNFHAPRKPKLKKKKQVSFWSSTHTIRTSFMIHARISSNSTAISTFMSQYCESIFF